jgi:OOP family OmpA-OmpF porin
MGHQVFAAQSGQTSNFKLAALAELPQEILEKNMKKIAKTVGALGLVGCAVLSIPYAAADDSFWYLGGNIGKSRTQFDETRIRDNLSAVGRTMTSFSDEERDTAFKLFGGYQFNKYFAVEGGYFDLGKLSYTATTAPAGTLNGNIQLNGLNIDAVGMLPLSEKFSAFGRVGVNYAQARDNFSSSGAIATPTDPNPSKTAANYKYGLGVQYNLTESLAMRVEAERYRIDDAIGNKGDVDMYSLGLVYRFEKRKPAPVEKVLMPKPVVVVVQAPAPPPEVIVVTAPRKVVFSADSDANALFEFGKTDLKPTGKRALDKFAAELKGADYEVITITGHTDRIGSSASNMKLSTHRADAVKAYLVGAAGIHADKIVTKGAGESQPLTRGECKGNSATKKLVTCLAPDRRVEVEVTGIRPAK